MFTSCGSALYAQPRTFCRTVRRVALTGKVKVLRTGAVGKPSLNRARVSEGRRTEPTSVEKGGDEVWIGEKFQSNPEIAGSPRNSFRASLGRD